MEKTVEQSIDDLEKSKEYLKPRIDMAFDSEIAAYNFYNAYGCSMGFSIRREVLAKDKNGLLTSRVFVCCKEGYRGHDKRDDLTKNPRAETRTGCGAHMGIKLSRRTDKYYVYRFSEEHNHPLLSGDVVHMFPSQRNVTTNSVRLPKCAVELMGQRAGGRESLGFYLRTARQKNMKSGEASYLMEYFSKQMLENPSFFHEIQLDSEERITNIFWCDVKMIMDYSLFGDVVSFDTTYKLNEASRPVAVFVGLNHHREMVIFGAALMYDETVASYIWLLETFFKAMGGKHPQTVFTDQDEALAEAVLQVMPDTYHQLCVWHLMQNAQKNASYLFRGHHEHDGNVLSTFLYEIEEEDEFLSAWQSMLDQYGVHDDPWLDATYAMRKKWVHAYVKWTWSVGMRSTQLSESLNASLKGFFKSDLPLPEFFNEFERMVHDMRNKELKAEYDLVFRNVHCKMEVSMLLHAREIYTKAIFEVFQAQFEHSLMSSITKCVSNVDKFIFTVVRDGFTKEWIVTREGESTVSCSCRMFETVGVLCRHCIKVMAEGRETTLIKKIPEQYVLNRWTKNARVDSVVQDMRGHESVENPRMKQTPKSRYRSLCSKLVRVASRASESKKAYEAADIEVDKLSKMVEDLLRLEIKGGKTVEDLDQNALVDSSNDPTTLNAKGFKKRRGS